MDKYFFLKTMGEDSICQQITGSHSAGREEMSTMTDLFSDVLRPLERSDSVCTGIKSLSFSRRDLDAYVFLTHFRSSHFHDPGFAFPALCPRVTN